MSKEFLTVFLIKDAVILFVVVAACFGVSEYLSAHKFEDEIIPVIGNSIENISALKEDCEKSLPADEECVMVYDFVPVKRDKK